MHLLQYANNKDEEKKNDIESTIGIVNDIRHKFAHNDNVLLLHDYKELTNQQPKWIKLAEILISANRNKASEKGEKKNVVLLNQLKVVCSSLQSNIPDSRDAKTAFSFAFENTQ